MESSKGDEAGAAPPNPLSHTHASGPELLQLPHACGRIGPKRSFAPKNVLQYTVQPAKYTFESIAAALVDLPSLRMYDEFHDTALIEQQHICRRQLHCKARLTGRLFKEHRRTGRRLIVFVFRKPWLRGNL